MPLYWFLLVITALASDSIPVRSVPAAQALLASAGLMLGWALLTRLAARSATRQVLSGEVAGGPAGMALGQQLELMRWLGLAMCSLALIGFGVAGLLDRIPWVAHSIAMRAMLLLLPPLAATLWSWWCELQFDNATHPHLAAPSPLAHLVTMFRLQGAWLVAPILLLLLAIDAAGWGFGIAPAHSALAGGVFALLGLPLALPALLGRSWHLRPIGDPAMAGWCRDLVAEGGVRSTPVLEWVTDDSFCTAMMAGFVPRFRRLLLSDALLRRLTPQQSAMVVLHELAHIRRWHLPLRMLVLVPVWGVASLTTLWMGDYAYGDVMGIAMGLACSLVALRWVAYRTEFDADAYACRMAVRIGGRVPLVPTTRESAGRALADALLAVTAGSPESRKATWLHPSVEDRCGALLSPHPAAAVVDSPY